MTISDRKRKSPAHGEAESMNRIRINTEGFHRSTHVKENVQLEEGAVLVEGVVVKRFKILRGSHQLVETEKFIGYDWMGVPERVEGIQDFSIENVDILPSLRNKFQ